MTTLTISGALQDEENAWESMRHLFNTSQPTVGNWAR